MPRTPIRALTRSEAIPPTVEAPDTVRAAVEAYEAAQAEHAKVDEAYGIGGEECHEAWLVVSGRRRALEDLLCGLALTHGRAWYRVGDSLWGLRQGARGSGFELARRAAGKGQTP